MIKFSAFADEVTDDFKGQVEFLASQNISNIEIRFVNQKNIMDLSAAELKETKNLLDSYSIGVSAIGSPIGKVKIDDDFRNHFERFKHAVELANYFDSPFIRVFSYYAPSGESINNYRNEVIERMTRKADYLSGTGLVMVHENESHIFGHSAENCLDIVKSVDSTNLRLAYDPANFVWSDNIKNNVEVCWPLMKRFTSHIHIKDWKIGSTDVGSMPGSGDGQIPELLVELAKMDYSGFITMEPHLKTGGQFGGETGPELFSQAIEATRNLCDMVGLEYN